MKREKPSLIIHFSRKIDAKYYTIIIDKKYTDNYKRLKRKITIEINNMAKQNEEYFSKFNKVIIYYDNGQEPLRNILDTAFQKFENFEHQINFNHTKKRLFQVADMLTFIDKYDYKNKHKLPLTKAEKYFFKDKEIGKIIKELNKKRL